MILRTAVIVYGLILLSGCGSHKHVIYPASKVQPVPYRSSNIDVSEKKLYLESVNRIRAHARQCGRKYYAEARPLKWSDTLYRAAYEHSKDMALCSHFAHSGSGTESDWTAEKQKLGRCSTFINRIENNGYLRYRGIAENIAYGAKSTDTVMRQWIGSERHCANIMNPRFTEFGMAKVIASDGRYYWTQDFGDSQ